MTTAAKYKEITRASGYAAAMSEEVSSTKTEQTVAVNIDTSPDAGVPSDRRTGFTMCPNWVYDVLLLEESPSTIKVVLFFNRNTTGRTDLKGHRIEFKQVTYKNIASRMKMSERAVGEAMRTALARGYLIQRCHETGTGEKSAEQSFFEGDFYALNWSWPLNFVPKTRTGINESCPNEGITTSLKNNESSNEAGGVANLPTISYPLPQSASPTDRSSSAGAQTGNLHQERQNLPVGYRQVLPTCINKAVIKNKEIELGFNSTAPEDIFTLPARDQANRPDSSTLNLSDHTLCLPVSEFLHTKMDKPDPAKQAGQSQQSSTAISNGTSVVNPVPKRQGSSAIGLLIKDLGREFGDGPDLLLPNISRTLNLWQSTSLSEKAFLDLIYLARQKTRECSSIRHRRTCAVSPLVGGQTNRMPYFFKVLSELSALPTPTGSGSNPPTNEKVPVYVNSNSSSPNLETSYRPNLSAGDHFAPSRLDGRFKSNNQNISRSSLMAGSSKLAASKFGKIGASSSCTPSEKAKFNRQWSGFGGVEVAAALTVAVDSKEPLPEQTPVEIAPGLSNSFTESTSTFNRSNSRDKDFNSDLSAIWHQVCDALKGRFQGGQLAETAQELNLTRGDTVNQFTLSAPGLPWLIKSFSKSDIALIRLVLRQFTGSGDFELVVG